MSRTIAISSLALAGLVGLASPARADVFVRAPFVRVHTGDGGVYVKAPFVRVGVPGVAFAPPAPLLIPEQPGIPMPTPLANGQVPNGQQPPVLLKPTPLPEGAMPEGALIRPMTISEFARCFKGGCGTYEVVLINPCTCQPCLVRFCLPDCPNRVTCSRDEVVFHYGLLRKVRIHFDGRGATVSGRAL